MAGQKSGVVRLSNTNYFRTVDYFLIVPILLLTIIGLYVLNAVLSDGYARTGALLIHIRKR